ncbi:MAG: hypothetical protein WBG46_10120 [Nonlabens sp.]
MDFTRSRNKNNLFWNCSTISGKRLFILGIVFFLASLRPCSAQVAKAYSQNNSPNSTRTSLYDTDFETVDVIFENYIELEVQNSEDGQVHLLEIENGEYKEATKIIAYTVADTLVIKGLKPPNFDFPQGKLSAHKVIDSRLLLQLPENKKLIVSTQEAQIDLSGSFNNVFINQLSGSCKITGLKSDLQYVSIYGDVFFTNRNHKVTCNSKNHKKTTQIFIGKFKYLARIETIHGKVTVI